MGRKKGVGSRKVGRKKEKGGREIKGEREGGGGFLYEIIEDYLELLR